MKLIARLPRWARVIIWIVACLGLAVVCLFVWVNQFHGIFPLTPSQRRALRATVQHTRRIEIHRYGDSRATLVITNTAEIERFGQVMTSRWQFFYCLCRGMTDMWFIDSQGRTNIANITDEYIKFGGPWAEHVVFRMYQAVPPKPLLDLMAQQNRALDASAHQSSGANAASPRRSL